MMGNLGFANPSLRWGLAGEASANGHFHHDFWFSTTARDYVGDIQDTVVLIDGPELADLMIDHNVGVSSHRRDEIRKINEDY